jgi:hypothetical protein
MAKLLGMLDLLSNQDDDGMFSTLIGGRSCL